MKRFRLPDIGDLDAAGVISVFAQRRDLARAAGHPVCGEYIGLTWRRRERVCALDPEHVGEHSTDLPLRGAPRPRPPA